MRWRFPLLAAFSAGLLSACGSDGPDRVGSSSPTVSFEFAGQQELDQATEQAEGYCDRFDLKPKLRHVTRREGADDIAVFDCR